MFNFFGPDKQQAIPTNDAQAFAMALSAMYQPDAQKYLDALAKRAAGQSDQAAIKAEVIEKFCCLDLGSAGNKRQARLTLSGAWDVHDSATLMQVLEWLLTVGHRDEYQYWLEVINSLHITSEQDLENGSIQLPDEHNIDDAKSFVKYVLVTKDRLGQSHIAGWDMARFSYMLRLGYVAGYVAPEEAWQQAEAVAAEARQVLASWREFAESFSAGRGFWNTHPDQSLDAVIRRLLEELGSPWQVLSWPAK